MCRSIARFMCGAALGGYTVFDVRGVEFSTILCLLLLEEVILLFGKEKKLMYIANARKCKL